MASTRLPIVFQIDFCNKDDPKEKKLLPKPAAITSCVPSPSRPRTFHKQNTTIAQGKDHTTVKQCTTSQYIRIITCPTIEKRLQYSFYIQYRDYEITVTAVLQQFCSRFDCFLTACLRVITLKALQTAGVILSCVHDYRVFVWCT